MLPFFFLFLSLEYSFRSVYFFFSIWINIFIIVFLIPKVDFFNFFNDVKFTIIDISMVGDSNEWLVNILKLKCSFGPFPPLYFII